MRKGQIHKMEKKTLFFTNWLRESLRISNPNVDESKAHTSVRGCGPKWTLLLDWITAERRQKESTEI